LIQLTRLNTQPLVVNSDLIKFVENAPDTVLTLISGEKVVVREGAQEVIERIIQFRRSVLAGLSSQGTDLNLVAGIVNRNQENQPRSHNPERPTHG
jgi:uncharacterized protein YlzI (FlbEa/FlbD family)